MPRAVRIRDFLLAGEPGNQLRLDAEFGLPFPDSREAELELLASGPDVSALPVQPQRLDLKPLPFEARLRASLQGDRLTVDKGNLILGEAELDWHGTFDLPPAFSATESTLSVNVPELAALGRLDGEPLPAAPFRLHASASGTRNAFRLDSVEAQLGASRLTGDLKVDVGGTRPRLEAKIHVPTLKIPVSDAPEDERPKAPADGRLIPDVALPFDRLYALDGAVQVRVDELRFGAVTFTQGSLAAVLEKGALTVDGFDIRPPSGRLQGRLAIRPDDASTSVHVELHGDRVALNVAANLEPSAEPSNRVVFDLDVDLQATGTDTRALAASLEGQISALSDGGRVYNRQLALVFGGFGRELLGNINPFIRQDRFTDLSCVLFRFAAADGIRKADPYLAVRSDKLNLVSSGFANLATERIDFTFNALPRRRLSVSATELINPYVRVNGTLLKPSLSLDSKNAAVTGGAAALTGGLSLLAQATWKRTFGSRDVCGKALKELRANERAAASEAPVTTP